MAIMIREYSGYDKFEVEFNYPIDETHFQESVNNLIADPISADSLMVDIEGIHAFPHATRNFTRYMPECLKGSVPTWTRPYKRPVIKHHNEKDGVIIGRIQHVEYVSIKTLSNTPALVFTVNIPDKLAMEEVKDGRLDTVSIGIIAHDVRCSICGHQIAEDGPCQDHERGQIYGKKTCYWDIYKMEAKELSYVIVPSDIFGKNIRIYNPSTQRKTNISEGYKEGAKKMNEAELEEKVLKLEKELKESKEQVASATSAKDIAETALATLKEENSTLTAKVTELTESNSGLAVKNTELSESVLGMTSEIAQEKELKEDAENQHVELKGLFKTNLVETLSIMRKSVGKQEISEASLLEKNEDFLQYAIADLREDVKKELKVPGSITNPGLSEQEKNNKIVDDKKDVRNIDLQEDLKNLFGIIVNTHK